jgi:hypothetical protein
MTETKLNRKEKKEKQTYAFIQHFFSRLIQMCVQVNSTSLLTLLGRFQPVIL